MEVFAIKIPVYQPSLKGKEKEFVLDCLDSAWISSKGNYIERFERSFAERINVTHATAVCNGTVALHLAMLALGIGQGDEVIVPTLTYVAPVNAVSYTGATPVFCDSLRTTWQISPNDVKRKITSKTKAIVVVHLYGHPCDMDSIMALANENNLFVIEDCAEAFGSMYKGRSVGAIGHVATFSFYGNKTITTGEGGMVVSGDQTLIDRAKHYKGQGLALHRQYWHEVVGYNYRMTNICAAIGLAQLDQADSFIRRKREIAEFYRETLKHLPVEVHSESEAVLHTYWMVTVLTGDEHSRDSLRQHLQESGIETRPVFYPVHTMPMYSARFQSNPVAEDISRRGINLPSWPGLRDVDLSEVARCISTFYE